MEIVLSVGAGAFGSAGIVGVFVPPFAFAPCILRLMVLASAIANAVAPDTAQAFTTFVANGFKSLNANCLALVAFSKLCLLYTSRCV